MRYSQVTAAARRSSSDIVVLQLAVVIDASSAFTLLALFACQCG